MLARASDRGLMFVRVQNLSEFVLNLTRQNLIQDLAFRILQTLWYSCVSRFVRSCVSRFVVTSRFVVSSCVSCSYTPGFVPGTWRTSCGIELPFAFLGREREWEHEALGH